MYPLPKKPSPAKSSRADLLADAAAAWAEAAPKPQISLRPGVDYTKDTYAAAFKVSPQRAQSLLKALVEAPEPKFARDKYRVVGVRQAEYVYWPIVAGPPG